MLTPTPIAIALSNLLFAKLLVFYAVDLAADLAVFCGCVFLLLRHVLRPFVFLFLLSASVGLLISLPDFLRFFFPAIQSTRFYPIIMPITLVRHVSFAVGLLCLVRPATKFLATRRI